jgi:uncharacterized membrane protein
MLSTFLVFLHLLATCIAVGILLIQDIALIRTHGRPLSKPEIAELQLSASRVCHALIALWITGLAIVLNGYLGHPDYVLNEKLWAKITVVLILTLNGVFLHYYAFPRITTGEGINNLKLTEKTLVALSGSVSSVSWLFACYLGIAKTWSFSASYESMMLIYFSLVTISFIIGYLCITYFSKSTMMIKEENIA